MIFDRKLFLRDGMFVAYPCYGAASEERSGAMSEQLATRKAIAEGRYGPDKILTREDVCGKIPDPSPE